ncbi:uncharacterized protein TrAFT101_000483 [Trichoderma asperellum]|uniref:uncharacterized protein n=1 Tax=Trichoderma asperellum TaxID=101201 RepID=UPI00331CCF4D|nr:hypothetical protein TrAFT101_000483 [Trichoderma asperellum]
MMCLQATPLPSSLLFGLAPQSVWSLLAVPAQRIFPQPNVWPSRKTMGCPAWLCLQLIPYPCTCTGPRPLVPTALAHDDDAQVVARWANPKKPLVASSSARKAETLPFSDKPCNLRSTLLERLPLSRFSSRVPLASVPEKPLSLTPIPPAASSPIQARQTLGGKQKKRDSHPCRSHTRTAKSPQQIQQKSSPDS